MARTLARHVFKCSGTFTLFVQLPSELLSSRFHRRAAFLSFLGGPSGALVVSWLPDWGRPAVATSGFEAVTRRRRSTLEDRCH